MLPALLVPQGLRWAALMTDLQRLWRGSELLLLLHPSAQLVWAHCPGKRHRLLLQKAAAPLLPPEPCRHVPPQWCLHLRLGLLLRLLCGPAQGAGHPAWQLLGRP